MGQRGDLLTISKAEISGDTLKPVFSRYCKKLQQSEYRESMEAFGTTTVLRFECKSKLSNGEIQSDVYFFPGNAKFLLEYRGSENGITGFEKTLSSAISGILARTETQGQENGVTH